MIVPHDGRNPKRLSSALMRHSKDQPCWRTSSWPNESGEDRYTASFNLMFSRFTELHSPPMIQKVVDQL